MGSQHPELMIRTLIRIFQTTIISVFIFSTVSAQRSAGGLPYSFTHEVNRQAIEQVTLKAPDYELLKRQDDSTSNMGIAQRMGICLSTELTIENSGTYTEIRPGRRIWQLSVHVDDAIALGLYYKDFNLAFDDSLFIYSDDKSHLIGAFTSENNNKNRVFATEPVKGETIILELSENTLTPEGSNFMISEVLVVYQQMPFPFNGISATSRNTESTKGDSEECEVSTVCPEGDDWRDQINGVVRIMIKNGNTAYWCTGSVMNNTALDFSPLILTADHCALSNGRYASQWDRNLWIFFFRHEATTCEDDTPSGTRSLTGCVKLASSTPLGNDGSDFYLVQLKEDIPNSYNPFFQGWSASDELSNTGVTIHHPAGDVKKISTYNTPLEYSQWGDTPQTHLMVQWSATTNGHGVTEGGSSGCPLFNASKRIIGQLTGGESDCSYLAGYDHFGRIYYSWDKNGENDTLRLQPWLDPLNSGLRVLDGSYNTKTAIAQFVANQTTIPVGSYITFNDLSINNPTQWEWIFEGGSPSSAQSRQPGLIYYDRLGNYDVTLVVSNEFGTDSLYLEDYIRVVPAIYPNPTRNNVFILFGNDENEHEITITNVAGKLISNFTVPGDTGSYEFSFLPYSSGIYIIKVKSNQKEEQYKIVYTPL